MHSPTRIAFVSFKADHSYSQRNIYDFIKHLLIISDQIQEFGNKNL